MTSSGNDMNCEDYQEAIAADPTAPVNGVAEHLAGCASCAGFQAEMLAFNDKIRSALAINTPDLNLPELPDLEDDNVVDLPFRRKLWFSTPVWVGIAASFALVAIVAIQMVNTPGSGLSLAEEILAHVDHEPYAMVVTNVAVADRRLSRIMSKSSGTVNGDIGLVTYAQSCIINGHIVPHLVIQGKKGPITLLLMPDEMIDGATVLEGKGVNGVILPVGNGSIAIIGERDEPLDEVTQRVIDSVEWSI